MDSERSFISPEQVDLHSPMYTVYHRYMTTQKRPRIDPWNAELIDRERGSRSFEEYVNDTLHHSFGGIELVPDPLEPRKYAVAWQEDFGEPGTRFVATGLPQRNAEVLWQKLRGLSVAYAALSNVYEWCETTGDTEHYQEAQALADAVFALLERMSGKEPAEDAEDDDDEG